MVKHMQQQKHYILDDAHNIIEVDYRTWSRWLDTNLEAALVESENVGSFLVSTVFMGVDHSEGDGPPLIFQTLVFPSDEVGRKNWHSAYCELYSTWSDAEVGHAHITAYIAACGRPPGHEETA